MAPAKPAKKPNGQSENSPHVPLFVLVLLAAVSPLAINMFVPSMPSIAADLDASYTSVQFGLSLYLLFTALFQLVIGPASDKIGRKPVLVFCLIIFLIGTALCVLAQDVSVFLAGRILQTTSAAGIVLSRTIVRDIYPRDKSASMIGYVVMGMAIAPMIGPAIGGFLDGLAGWRASFIFLGFFGLFVLAVIILRLPETNSFSGQTFSQQVHHWLAALKMRAFWLYAMTASLSTSVFFGFLGGGPAVSSEHFGQSPLEYGLWFSLCAGGYALGNFFSGRFSQSRGLERMMVDGAIIALGGTGISLTLFAAGFDHPAILFVPLALIGIGNGMTLPNVTAATISLRPEASGAISGLMGALQIGLGTVGSILGALAAGASGSPLALTSLLAVLSAFALIVTIFAARPQKQPADRTATT